MSTAAIIDEIKSRHAAYEAFGGIVNERQSVEDVPKLLTGLEAVLALHRADSDTEDVIAWDCVDGPCEHGDEECPLITLTPCVECSGPEYSVAYPCPTVRAITEAVG